MAWGGYNWLKTTYTDSAAAATAMATGQKTYNNAINWSDFNVAIMPTVVEAFHNAGKATGTITSVQWSHATPAGFSNAHNVSRNNYAAIANQMLDGQYLDVIMGAGNPDFNNNGQPASNDAKYVGGATTWSQLKGGTHPGGWQLVETKNAFENLTTGNPTGRFVGVPQVYTTLQQARSANGQGGGYGNPSGDAFNQNVPTLQTMTRGALNVLDADPDGFFLQIEGGAPDWTNHANQGARMIEEQMDFNRSVEAVVGWVDANSNWNDTLLLIAADHDTGLLWGPDSANVPFDAIRDNGYGVMPSMAFNSGDHTNSLVPLYAMGAGSELLSGLVDGNDALAAAAWRYANGWNGDYVDNTDMFTVMMNSGAKNIIVMISDGAGFNVWDATSMYEGMWVVPEPGSVALCVIGLLALRRR
jgi:alkaline phosphatase